MSPRFWLFSLASAGGALACGLSLGLYATTPPRIAFTDADASYSEPAPVFMQSDPGEMDGPEEIICQGCGPTLAQRQTAAMMGDWSGYDDPVVQQYEAQDQRIGDDWSPAEDPQPAPAHQLPENAERFASGEADGQLPGQWAQRQAMPSQGRAAVATIGY